jgi:hypothetical protein
MFGSDKLLQVRQTGDAKWEKHVTKTETDLSLKIG